MHMHTDHPAQVIEALRRAAQQLAGVYVEATEHRSKSRAGAIEFWLEGTGYFTNPGSRGSSSVQGGTWDEWGFILAQAFEADPEALVEGVYDGFDDFHYKTSHRFSALNMPADTHKRHIWQPTDFPRVQSCSKCSAVRKG